MIGGKENDDMFSRAALSLKGWQQENAELQDEIDRLKQENLRLGKLATQRGARMQIMRKWLSGIESGCLWESDDEWGALIEARPEAADWFDEDGVPK